MNFDTTSERRGDDVVIHVAGEFDLYSAPEFKAQLADAIAADGGELSLVCTDRSILRVFEITGLDRVFTIQRTPTPTLPLLTVSAS